MSANPARNESVDLSGLRIQRAPPSAGVRGGRMGWLAASAVVAVGAFAAGYVVRGGGGGGAVGVGGEARAADQPAATLVKPPPGGVSEVVLTASGYVVADRTAVVSPKTNGRVAELATDDGRPLREGMEVKRGELLARLDSADRAARVEAIERSVDEARASLREIWAQWNDEQRRAERMAALARAGDASQETLESSQARAAALRARHEAVEASIEARRASLREAKEDLAATEVRAPFAGTVLDVRVEVGEMVSSGSFGGDAKGTTIVVLADRDTLEMDVDVNETRIALVGLSQPALVVLDAFPERIYHGAVRLLMPQADRARGVVPVRVIFLDADAAVLPQMAGQVRFQRFKGASTGAPDGR